jgi:hypothetical protein
VIDKTAIDRSIDDDKPKNWNIIKTEPIPVRPNTLYNYTITIEAENLDSLQALVYYLTDTLRAPLPDSNTPSNTTTNGKVLVLSPQSEIFTKLDILKPSNYTIALRVKMCETCTFVRVSIGDDKHDISLASQVPQHKWLYYTTSYLEEGNYKLKIYSDSKTELDSVVMYSSFDKKNEILEDVFVPKESPAHILKYEKINPTKYVVTVNAVKPYVLTFAETFDPLWTVYIDGIRKNNSNDNIPLYSIVNGFSINKLGEHTLAIEYEPQRSFYIGIAISLITMVGIPIGYYTNSKTKRGKTIIGVNKAHLG